MKMQEIVAIARQRAVMAGKMKKAELIRTIQRAEGNNDCFGSGLSGECDQTSCLWRGDCLIEDSKGNQQ